MRVSTSSACPKSFPQPERCACQPPAAPFAHYRQVAAHFRPRGRGSAHGPRTRQLGDFGVRSEGRLFGVARVDAGTARRSLRPGRRRSGRSGGDRGRRRPGGSVGRRRFVRAKDADWFAALLVPVDRFGRVDFSGGPAGVPQSGRAGADRRADGHDSRPRARREPSPADSRRKPGHAVPRLASGPKANGSPGGTAVPFAPRAGSLAPLDPGARGGVSAFPGGVSFRCRDGQGAGINDASRSIGAGRSCS